MSKKDKAVAKLRQNQKNIRFEEIEVILIRLGFKKRQEGTSHAVFTLAQHRIVVPHRRPFVKPGYVRLLLQILDDIQELDDSDEN